MFWMYFAFGLQTFFASSFTVLTESILSPIRLKIVPYFTWYRDDKFCMLILIFRVLYKELYDIHSFLTISSKVHKLNTLFYIGANCLVISTLLHRLMMVYSFSLDILASKYWNVFHNFLFFQRMFLLVRDIEIFSDSCYEKENILFLPPKAYETQKLLTSVRLHNYSKCDVID